jgi:hypothetical protein
VSDDPVIDTSRVDNYLRSRHRVEVLNSAWKPALAGAAGAVAIIGAVVVGVWIATPRFSYRDIEIPRVTMRDVVVPNIVQRDVTIDIPHFVQRDAKAAKVAAPPDAPRTPSEKKFVATPEYKTATYRGRIVKSRDGLALSFAEGRDFWPYHWDDATGTSVPTPGRAMDSDPFVGLLGLCVPQREHPELWECRALKDGVEVPILDKPASDSDRNPPPARIRTASEARPT